MDCPSPSAKWNVNNCAVISKSASYRLNKCESSSDWSTDSDISVGLSQHRLRVDCRGVHWIS